MRKAPTAGATTISDGASEKHFMAYSQGRNFLFCDLCGSLVNLNSIKYAQCPLCKLQRNVKATSYYCVSLLQDIRRDLGISIIREGAMAKGGCAFQFSFKAVMRSADEGATTFYVCTNCQHQSTENLYIPKIVRDYGTCS
ncbi:hypothetical protein C1H46_016439 [Malus baccata]|uniref:TFIIS-type domain-containing protein n=1 Tax=Malus baccata TaxID=106549 RepID=A0A540MGR4_MALBA|nr:hypothetical protein C1H46_016439 [Malus baccata]